MHVNIEWDYVTAQIRTLKDLPTTHETQHHKTILVQQIFAKTYRSNSKNATKTQNIPNNETLNGSNIKYLHQ